MPLRLSSALLGLIGLLSLAVASPVSAGCPQTIESSSKCDKYGSSSGGKSKGISIHNSYGATACVYLCQSNGGYPSLALTGTGGPSNTLGEIPSGATHTVYINQDVYYTVLKEDQGHLYFHDGSDYSTMAQGDDGAGASSLTISSSTSRRRRLLSMMSDNEQEEGEGDSPASRRLLATSIPIIKVNVH